MSNLLNNAPPFDRKWFWDFDYYKMDWQASYKTVIARIIERGPENQWRELVKFYGKQKVMNALINEIPYLPDYSVEEVSKYFSIPKEKLLCYSKKLSRPTHWI